MLVIAMTVTLKGLLLAIPHAVSARLTAEGRFDGNGVHSPVF